MVCASGTLGYNHARVHSHSIRKWSPLKKVIYNFSDTNFTVYCSRLMCSDILCDWFGPFEASILSYSQLIYRPSGTKRGESAPIHSVQL
jgi:hypothetical protein